MELFGSGFLEYEAGGWKYRVGHFSFFQVNRFLVGDLAREVSSARYGALTVLGAQGAVENMYTSGLSAGERELLEVLPQGHGALKVVHDVRGPVRIRDVATDPRSGGIPPHHPVIHSLISVPLAHGGNVLGTLYLANPTSAEEFSAEDEHLLTVLAGHAATVIEFARLTLEMRTLAVDAERERIRKDLHDGVIQSIFGVNLELESAVDDLDAQAEPVKQRINMVIDRLADVMKDIRSYILGLQPVSEGEYSLPEALAALLAETRAHTLLETDLFVKGPANALPAPLSQELMQIARETVANVVRHARAGRLWATLQVADEEVHLRIVDNGAGFSPENEPRQDQHGLRNLRQRTHNLGGTLSIQSSPGTGTAIDVRIPLVSPVEQESRDV